MKLVEFAGHQIGRGRPCFVIAEAGVNHNGDPRLARELIDAAYAAGVDAVKFQTWITEKLVTRDAAMADYQAANTNRVESQFDMLKRLELSRDVFRDLKTYADRRGILFLSTPDEEDSCDFLEQLALPLFKIGSGEVTNLPYLRHVGAKGRPVILSTGMSTLEEVRVAVRTLEESGCRDLVLLHCVSEYPALPSSCNLRAMDTLAEAFDYPVGFSDHTMAMEVSWAAVARGAAVIEKHFTLDRSLPGPDHKASLLPAELAEFVRGIRSIESALGDGVKQPTAGELRTRKVVQRSIVAGRDLSAGTRLGPGDLALLRAAGGLGAAAMAELVGKVTARSLKAGELIERKDVR